MARTIEDAKAYGIVLHSDCGKRYGNDLPYSFHLQQVESLVCHFKCLLSSEEDLMVLRKAAWLHDTLEDCGITYSDLKSRFGADVADLVYDVTNELGKNRRERHERTLPKIKSNRLAIYLKLCDRIANMVYSKYDSSGSMYAKYVAEWPEFKAHLFREEFEPMFEYCDRLINLR